MIDDQNTEQFVKALESGDLKAIQEVPKTDLHCHGSLSMRRSSLEQWRNISIPKPPKQYPTFLDFINYIKQNLHPHTDHAEGLRFCLMRSLEEAAADGVVYTEMSIDLKFVDFFPDIEKFITVIREIKEETEYLIHFAPEIGIKRTAKVTAISGTVEKLIESGVFESIDLYDDELAGNIHDFKPLFQVAKDYGLKRKAHTGEYHTASSVAICAEVLELDAIQHGIHAADDLGVMKILADLKIPLNICPTSNVALKRIKKIRNHPIRKLFDHGVIVTINSDDILLFDQSVSEEYYLLFNEGVFSAEELDFIRISGLLQRL